MNPTQKQFSLNRAASKANSYQLVGLMFLFITALPVGAETKVFTFDGGIGSDFFTRNSSNLWTLDTDGPTFRVTKAAENGSVDPNGFIFGSINSTFGMTGNFLVTVDFNLLNFPAAGPHPNALNESVLTVNGSSNDEVFLVLRFRHGSSDHLEIYANPGGPIGVQNSSITSGRYQIERVGNTLTGRFASNNGDVFTTLGSVGGFTSSRFQIQLSGVQGLNAAGVPRSSTALDIEFDNLTVQADGFVAIAPRIQGIALAGTNVIIKGTNGFQGNSYYVLTSTNLILPQSNWTRIATNLFGGDGSFLFTNAIGPDSPERFYTIQLP